MVGKDFNALYGLKRPEPPMRWLEAVLNVAVVFGTSFLLAGFAGQWIGWWMR